MPDGTTIMHSALTQALEDLHTRIAATILGLEATALDWRPDPTMSSLHDLIVHVAAQERQWISEGIGNISAAPEARFTMLAVPAVQPADHVLFELGAAGQTSQMILASLGPDDWTAQRQVGGRVTTVAGCVLYTLIELARVLGQVENIAQLWDARAARAE